MSATNGKHPEVDPAMAADLGAPARPQINQPRKRIIHPPISSWAVEEVPAQLCEHCNGQASVKDGDKRVPCPACGGIGGVPGGKLLVARCDAPYERDDFFLDEEQIADVIRKLGGTVAERPPVTAGEPDSAVVLPAGATA